MSSRWAKYYALFIFVSPYLTLYQISMFSSFTYAFLYMEPMSQVKKKKHLLLIQLWNYILQLKSFHIYVYWINIK